ELQKVVRTSFAASDAESSAEHVEVEYHQADIPRVADLKKLLKELDGQVALYFAVPPSVAAAACDAPPPQMTADAALRGPRTPLGRPCCRIWPVRSPSPSPFPRPWPPLRATRRPPR